MLNIIVSPLREPKPYPFVLCPMALGPAIKLQFISLCIVLTLCLKSSCIGYLIFLDLMVKFFKVQLPLILKVLIASRLLIENDSGISHVIIVPSLLSPSKTVLFFISISHHSVLLYTALLISFSVKVSYKLYVPFATIIL